MSYYCSADLALCVTLTDGCVSQLKERDYDVEGFLYEILSEEPFYFHQSGNMCSGKDVEYHIVVNGSDEIINLAINRNYGKGIDELNDKIRFLAMKHGLEFEDKSLTVKALWWYG